MRDGEKSGRDLLLSALKSDQSVGDLKGQLAEPSNVDRSGRLRVLLTPNRPIHSNEPQTKRTRAEESARSVNNGAEIEYDLNENNFNVLWLVRALAVGVKSHVSHIYYFFLRAFLRAHLLNERCARSSVVQMK